MTIDRSHPIAVRLLTLMEAGQGWSARWLGDPNWLDHESGLIVCLVDHWTAYYDLDPEPPHLVIYPPGGHHMDLPLTCAPGKRWLGLFKRRGELDPRDPYAIHFHRLSERAQAEALDTKLPAEAKSL